MQEIVLYGDEMTSKNVAHEYIKTKLNFPDYYGCNLDALWDLLSMTSESVSIKVVQAQSIKNNLGSYGESLIELFLEASESNSKLKVIVQE